MKLGLPEKQYYACRYKRTTGLMGRWGRSEIYLQEIADVIVDPDQMDLYKY